MDNHIFRSAIGGFNRQDVMDYIEKTQKEAAENAAALEKQLDQVRRELAELGNELDGLAAQRDTLTEQLEEVTGRCETARANWESHAAMNETLRGDVSQRDTAIRELTGENQELFRRVQALEEELNGLRQEKEKVAQLELEAHKRGEEVIADAHARSELILSDARREADTIREQADAAAAQLRRETAEQLQSAVDQYHGLVSSFGSIADHVAGELRKMGVTAAQLPICFDHAKSGLDAVMEKIRGQ